MDIWSMMAEGFDLPILDWIAANLWNPALDWLMPKITVLGDAGIFWIACAVILMLIPKTRKAGFSMGLALLMGVALCNMTLKPLVGRIRPYDYQEQLGIMINLLIEKEHSLSFPSGHTIASFEAATAILLRHKKLGIAALILAILIAVVDFLPLLGTGIILIPWAVVSLLLGEVRLGIGLLVLYAVSSVLRQIFEPKLIGDGLGLHPLLSLAAMYGGLRLFGVWGMILAPLAAAGVRAVFGGNEGVE